MKRKLVFALVSAATLAVVPVLADEAAPAATTTATATPAPAAGGGGGGGSGVEIGLRLGYGIAMGNYAKDAPMSDGVKGQIPIRLDAGYRINPNIYVGAYFSYGIGMINKDKIAACNNGADCSASTLNFGVMAAYHIMPDQSFDPWVGVGFGLENATSKISAGGISASQTAKGLTFLDLQVGGDYKVNNNLGIGPFVSFALGQYSSVSGDGGSGDIQDKAMHEWLTIGIRGAYGIW